MCNVTSNSDQMVPTLQLNFALRLQNYRKGLITFSRTTCKVSPACGEENMMQSLCSTGLHSRPVEFPDTDTKHIFASFRMTYTSKCFH